jgi:alkylated DNA repair dioxygenase AlkB
MPPAIPGLRYVPDYLDADDHDRLLFTVNACGWQHAGGRGVQIYGYSYHHAKGGIYRVGDLPAWASDVAGRLWRDGLMPYAADQMIANQSQGGVGIFSHVDAPAFDDSIVSLSLGSSCAMQFTECDSGRVEEMLVEPRSAVVISGEAREKWKHGIPARSEDLWMNQVVPRGTRVSLTFRKMLISSGMA